jgi:type III secretory pathway component EscU
MMQEVPKANVVITNPTHVAMALTYDKDKMAAPVVIAKGGLKEHLHFAGVERPLFCLVKISGSTALARDRSP